MTASARLGLPLMQPGQAQKEMTHNEALAMIDIAAQASVVAVGTNAPPGAPAEGQCWLVGSAPSGGWVGQAGTIAGWTSGGWRFVAPRAGFTVWCQAESVAYRHDGTVWRIADLAGARVVVEGVAVVGAQRGAIVAGSGGTIVDAEARAAISAILAALRGHGLIAG